MKKVMLIAFLLTGLMGLFIFAGCDDDDNPVDPVPSDEEYEMAMEEFEGMEELTGSMINLNFAFIGAIFDSVALGSPPTVAKTASDIEFVLKYDDASQFWVFSIDIYNALDSTAFEVYDSVQFRHASGPVQWPNEDSVVAIESYEFFSLADSSIGVGTAYQHLTITADSAGSDTVMVNGIGGYNVDVTFEEVEGTDTTTCDVLWNVGLDFTDVELDMTTMDNDEVGCPLTGNVEYLGRIGLSCVSNSGQFSFSSNWTLSQTFDHGTISYLAESGGNTWTSTETCQ